MQLMKILVFNYGLGNQLFQYARYEYMKKILKQKIFYVYDYADHNGFEIYKYFNVEIKEPSRFSKFMYRLLMKCYYNGAKWLIYKENQKKSEAFYQLIVLGGWQNKKYLIDEMATFSYWAAKLSNTVREGGVFYPSKWFIDSYSYLEPDIFPDDWICI